MVPNTLRRNAKETIALDQCLVWTWGRTWRLFVPKENAMDEAEIERIAASVAKKMQEPLYLQGFARAIAAELNLVGVKYRAEITKIGQRLDKTHY